MKKQIILAAVAVVAMVSCAKNEAVDPTLATAASKAISFDSFIDRTTKGAVTNVTTLQEGGFGAIGYNTGNVAVTFDKVPVTYNNGVWSYETTKFWAEDDKISVYAYAPVPADGDTEMIVNSAASASDLADLTDPTIAVTTPTVITDQSDIVVATSLNNTYSATPAPINLNFNHILSKVGFTVQAGEKDKDNTQIITVKSVKVTVTAPEAGYYNGVVSKATYNMATGKWDYDVQADEEYLAVTETSISEDTFDETKGLVLTAEADDTAEITNVTDADKYLMLIPQTIGEGSVTVAVNYSVDNGTAEDKTATLPSFTFEQGKQYAFNLILADMSIRFGSVSVTDFVDGDGYTLNL